MKSHRHFDRDRFGSAHSGYTLMEMMVSLPLMVAIIAAAGGLIMAVSKSQSFANGLMADRASSLELQQRILTDLQFAQSLAENSAGAIEFSTPDRDGDSLEESIRYSWSGTAGDPLLYSINNSTAETLAENVHRFELDYTQIEDSSETVIKNHDDSRGGQFSSFIVDGSRSVAQFFVPELPASASNWFLDRVRIRARSIGVADGTIRVSITKATSQVPNDSVYGTVEIDESQLANIFGWIDVEFPRRTSLEVDRELCIVVSAESGTDGAAEIEFETLGDNMTANTHWVTSDNTQLTWSIPNELSDMRFYVIGEHDGTTSAARAVVDKVQCKIQVGDNPNVQWVSTSRLINQPEVSRPLSDGNGGSIEPNEPPITTVPPTDPDESPTDPAPEATPAEPTSPEPQSQPTSPQGLGVLRSPLQFRSEKQFGRRHS